MVPDVIAAEGGGRRTGLDSLPSVAIGEEFGLDKWLAPTVT